MGQLELDFSFVEALPQAVSAQILQFPQDVNWTDEEVQALRDYILCHSLRMLFDGRAGVDVRVDVMDWLMSDEVHPFSFVVCSKAGGCNPLVLRQKVLERYESSG